MTNAYGKYDAPDGVTVPMAQPANCPYCGQRGAFDGHGPYGEGMQHRCPECGLKFVTFLPETDD